jgi:hypothetical protein
VFFHLDWIFLDLDFNTGLVFLDSDVWFFHLDWMLVLVFHWFWMFWFFIGIRYVARLSDVKLQLLMIDYKQ